MTGVTSISANGEIAHNLSVSGTYTVSADCTGSYTATASTGLMVNLDQFIAPDGSSLTFVQTTAEFVTAGSKQRVSRKKVSD